MRKYLIIFIFLLALFLRVYKLGQFPVGFLWDEAALGYNAFSILKTGRDEYGQLLPLIFKSFGDYKPGFYVYLTVPSILIFGLNEFAVRFPSALFGSLTVLIFYLLINEFLKKGFPLASEQSGADLFPLVGSFLLAISPWHIVFSRGAWELNVMLFELVLGFYLLTKYFNNGRNVFLIFSPSILLGTSFLFFVFSLFTYQSAKLLLPILVLAFLFFFRDEWVKTKKRVIPHYLVAIAAIFILFNLFTILGGKGGRIKAMSLFSYPRSIEETQMFLLQDSNNKAIFSLFHNKGVFFLKSFFGRYFNHFSGKFLFVSGDWSNQRNGVVYQGQMYYFDLFFILFGLFFLFAKKRQPLENFMLFWLLLAPVPAALTRDSISAVRSFTMVIPLIYVTANGVVGILNYLQRISLSVLKRLFYFLFFIFYLFMLFRFLDLYFVHDPRFTSENRLYGYKQAMEYVNAEMADKNKIIFTSKYGQPYIFYLFYSKYNPSSYQKKALLRESLFGDVGEVEAIDNIFFKKIYFPEDRSNNNSLFIGDEFDLPLKDVVGQNNITLLEEIKFLNDKIAFRIVETN